MTTRSLAGASQVRAFCDNFRLAPCSQRVEGRGKRVEGRGTSTEVLAVVVQCMSKNMHQTQMRELDAMGIKT